MKTKFHIAQKNPGDLKPPGFELGTTVPKIESWAMVLPGKIGEVERAFSSPPRPVVLMKKPCTQGAVPLLPLTNLNQTKCPHCE